jgi:hypothetical protein
MRKDVRDKYIRSPGLEMGDKYIRSCDGVAVMSRGLGTVQRGLIAILEASPGIEMTMEELAAKVYGVEVVELWQVTTISRAMRRSPITLYRQRRGRQWFFKHSSDGPGLSYPSWHEVGWAPGR